MLDARHFLGEWRQIRPDPAPARIFVLFEDDGHLEYIVETDTLQSFRLRWRLNGRTLITSEADGSSEIESQYEFRSPTMLVLEREGTKSVYRRT